MQNACNRILDITNDLSDYFNIQKLSSNKHLAPKLRVSDELENIITEKEYEYYLQDIKFIRNFNKNNIFLYIDNQAFKRAISNIINNAVDALCDQVGRITVSSDIVDNEVQICIEDNGKGMPVSIREKILNKISVTFGKVYGQGIGYMQIYDMLDENNGVLCIESKLNIGTKITLNFSKAKI